MQKEKKQVSRRKFIKSAGKVAVLAGPAASLIINASKAHAGCVESPSGRIDPMCQT